LSWGAKQSRGRLLVDGHEVERRRGSEGNFYALDGKELKAFGVNVPSPIADLLQVEAANFQQQFDLPYWLGQSAGYVGRELNSVVNLEVIDSTLAAITKELNLQRTAVKVSTERLAVARQRKADLDWVVAYNDKLTLAEEVAAQVAVKHARITQATAYSLKATTYRLAIRTASKRIRKLVKVVATSERILELDKQLTTLTVLQRQLQTTAQAATRKIPDLTTLEVTVKRLTRLQKRINKLHQLQLAFTEARHTCQKTSTSLQCLETTLQQKYGDRCPICGSTQTTK